MRKYMIASLLLLFALQLSAQKEEQSQQQEQSALHISTIAENGWANNSVNAVVFRGQFKLGLCLQLSYYRSDEKRRNDRL